MGLVGVVPHLESLICAGVTDMSLIWDVRLPHDPVGSHCRRWKGAQGQEVRLEPVLPQIGLSPQ